MLHNQSDEQVFVSALMYAVSTQDPRLVHILFKYGSADPYEIDNRHALLGDVLKFAERLGNQEIIDAIVRARIVEDNVKKRVLSQEQSDESGLDENGFNASELNENAMISDKNEYEI